ncbi:helix-turn-helix transcriptional regulator [Tianweitania sp. BSSL-BM11]|uniref:Helix-turn-helix transcriptional regulator n=1 Tax=Tianweitania aestuarii TaxID=2814886 RepID=A0ABS5RXL3_9HYPH|nr:helix-turn-helix transcriptional regulator [Tianweitania aestuarii]MBS9721779.1 helix-turn-helix transcriptional regulator [Tianweitania aestuarii]
MLSHEKVWAAIDALAARHALSASGLAKKAGLDSTAFNKSKRQSVDGRPRWPSTESLAKIMAATGSSLDEFMGFITKSADVPMIDTKPAKSVPLVGFAQAGAGGFFTDAGFPVGQGWDMVEAPAIVPEGGYALEVQGDSMLPLYRHGDRLIVDPNATARKGDRVVVKTTGGEVTAKILIRRTADLVELHSLNPEHPDRTLQLADIEWIARIVWASQ